VKRDQDESKVALSVGIFRHLNAQSERVSLQRNAAPDGEVNAAADCDRGKIALSNEIGDENTGRRPMRLAALAFLTVLIVGGAYWYFASQPGPAEEAGAMLDQAIDKGKRIIDIVQE
jgi:hypothetical protein